jgi:diguanylate cyclase (GGDEF)-like protein
VELVGSRTVNPEILDDMIEAELAMKYGCYSQALEILVALACEYPSYLPAKEALETVYRETGQIERADEIAREIALIRSQLANQVTDGTQSVNAQEQIRRRQFIAGVDSIVREVYDTRDEEEVLRVCASKLVENIRADRCVMIVREEDGHKAKTFEYCRTGVAPSLDRKTAKLNFLISKLVSESQDPIAINQAIQDPPLAECHPVLECFSIQSILACPLLYKCDRIGMIVVHQCGQPIQWDEQEVALLSTLAGHAAVALKNAQHFREAQTLEIKDELTGLHSRHFFEERLSVEIRNAQLQQYPLCLALVSIDDFQSIKTVHGQAVANLLLRKVGFLLKTHLRKGSVVARGPEDQFSVMLPNVSAAVSHQIMDHIKNIVEQNLITDSGGRTTVSVGVMEANLSSPGLRQSTLMSESEATPSHQQEPVTLSGDLSEIAVQDIVQILESGQKCGKLLISAAGQTGAILFNSGKIVDAGFRDRLGEPAVYDLLALRQAKFEYRPSPTPFPQVIHSSNTYLLLEGLRLLDEANRDHPEPHREVD